jgi:hypothetical protein
MQSVKRYMSKQEALDLPTKQEKTKLSSNEVSNTSNNPGNLTCRNNQNSYLNNPKQGGGRGNGNHSNSNNGQGNSNRSYSTTNNCDSLARIQSHDPCPLPGHISQTYWGQCFQNASNTSTPPSRTSQAPCRDAHVNERSHGSNQSPHEPAIEMHGNQVLLLIQGD